MTKEGWCGILFLFGAGFFAAVLVGVASMQQGNYVTAIEETEREIEATQDKAEPSPEADPDAPITYVYRNADGQDVTFDPHDKLKYCEEVVILTGFYASAKGIVVGVNKSDWLGFHYDVKLLEIRDYEVGNKVIVEHRANLKRVEK